MAVSLARVFSGDLAEESGPTQPIFRDRTRELSWDDPGVARMDLLSELRMLRFINSLGEMTRLFAGVLLNLVTCFV